MFLGFLYRAGAACFPRLKLLRLELGTGEESHKGDPCQRDPFGREHAVHLTPSVATVPGPSILVWLRLN